LPGAVSSFGPTAHPDLRAKKLSKEFALVKCKSIFGGMIIRGVWVRYTIVIIRQDVLPFADEELHE